MLTAGARTTLGPIINLLAEKIGLNGHQIILFIFLSISIEVLSATSQPSDIKVFDSRKLFDEGQKVILPRAGKTIKPEISPLNEIVFVTDVENEPITAEEKSDIESDTENVDLDPILDIRYFLNDVENATIDNKLLVGVNDEDSKKNMLQKTKKANISDAFFNPQGPTKATLFRDGKAINIQGGVDFRDAVFDEEMGNGAFSSKR